ncbi:diguanylate cyclase [Aquitalea magnusonii]|uniref:Diguanylate cyclase n=1 Tax=Aquitalea magnusonii TaxID=332411 RepID=A0A3G9GFM9_9NEIS|nr:PAS domain S-box protein [Aquitalea magnusonii]BBF85633.1 diguanylate cyclase [Aquitalea magnusonii]
MTAPSHTDSSLPTTSSTSVFQAMFDAADAALLTLDANGVITLCNPAAQQLLGYPAAELCGRHPGCLLAAERLEQECRQLAQRLGRSVAEVEVFTAEVRPGHSLQREWPLLDKQGREHTVRLSVTAIAGVGPNSGYMLVLQDITELKRMQQLMHRQHALFAAGPMVAFSCHPARPDVLVEVSPNVADILGCFPEDILLEPAWWLQRLHPDDRPCLADGQWRLAQGAGFVTRRYRFLHGSGHWCWLEEYVQQLGSDVVQGYWIDVTKQVDGEDRLTKIASNIPGMLYQFSTNPDGAGHFSYVSEGVRSIFGVSPQQVMHNTDLVWQRVFPDDQQRVKEESEAALRYEQPWISEFRILLPDGRMIWVEGRATPELQDDQSVRWHGLISEITQRKRTEEALRESQERLDMAMRGARIGLWDWHVALGRLDYNQQLVDMLGYDQHTLHCNPAQWQALVHPDDLPTVRHNIRALLKREARQYRIEYRLIKRSGEIMWILDKGQATEVDGNGNVCRIVGTVQDITTHKQAQKLLESSEAHFRMLFQNHGAVMILIDPDSGQIVDANASAVRFYGYRRDELVGMPVSQINLMEEERIRGTMGVALLQAHNHFTFTHRLASGELRTVDVHSSPVESGGRTLLFSIIHDITARRQAEDALSTLQRQLLAIIENFHGAILLEDQNGSVVLVNQQYCEMFMPDQTPEQLKASSRLHVAAQASAGFAEPERMLQRLEELQRSRQMVLGEEWALRDGRMLERDHVPIFIEGRLRSVLWVYRDISSRKKQEEALRQLATTDALTGIANRRSFMEKLVDEFARFLRFGNPVAVLMLDIDHFKQVNDTWGHAVGDKVLHDFAALCQQEVRQVDVLGRLGGEEFAVILPGCGMAGALALAERLREAVRAHVVHVGEASLQIHTSIGVSCFSRQQQDAAVALALADQALYEAKLAGRDQVKAFDGNGQRFPPGD